MNTKKTLVSVAVLIFMGMIGGAVITSRLEVTPTAYSEKIAQAASAEDTPAFWGKAFVGITKKVLPSVVTIYSNKKVKANRQNFRGFPDQMDERYREFFGPFHFFFQPEPGQEDQDSVQSGLGSGVIVSSDGYVLTNNHVVADVDLIQVQLQDGKEYKAEIVGKDSRSDLAILKIEAKDLPAATLGNSDDLEVGEIVIAIGSPMGLRQTVTMGIVSATDRYELALLNESYADFIQTDAVINPGNSGGALMNTKGEVIGINTAISSGSGFYMGYGFAIPSNMAKSIMKSLIETGKVVRGYIGIHIQNIDDALAKALKLDKPGGVLINDVVADKPGEKAGLKANDVVLRIDGKDIENSNALQGKVFSSAPGDKLNLTILRDGKEKEMTVVLTELDEGKLDARGKNTFNKTIGIEVADLTANDARQLGYDENEKGVVITKVESLTPGYNAGLQRGDLIVAINKEKIESVRDYKKASENAKKGDVLLIRYKRGDNFFSVGVVIE